MRRGSTSNVGPATKKLISTSSIDSVNAKSHPATTAGMITGPYGVGKTLTFEFLRRRALRVAKRLSMNGQPVAQNYNLSGFAEQMLVHVDMAQGRAAARRGS